MSNLDTNSHDAPPKRPRGILKNSFQKSPPVSPTQERELTEKELTIANTNANAGHRRSSSAASRPPGSRRQSTNALSHEEQQREAEENIQRLKWDEANLYLTEQERTSTMKITEPKTPYAKHYDPSEDEDFEEDDVDMSGTGSGTTSSNGRIPGLSLGEPEEEVPAEYQQQGQGQGQGQKRMQPTRKQSKVHVSDEDATADHDGDEDALAGMTPEEREKHRKFEMLRKKHYEMKDVAKFLGHGPDELEDEIEDDEDDSAPPPVPPMPTINGAKVGAGD